MANNFNHWVLKKYSQYIEVVLGTYKDFKAIISNLKCPSNNNVLIKTIIDWKEVSNHYFLCYGYMDIELEVTHLLLASDLNKEEFVLIGYYDYDADMIIQIPVSVFIQYWDELMLIRPDNLVVITQPNNLVMEFAHTDYYHLHSNFEIGETPIHYTRTMEV